VNQKLINKYEHKPTPSQPKNNWKKLLLVTKISIKNVKKDNQHINLDICGSWLIYAMEYKCTKKDIVLITKTIIIVIVSKIKPISIEKISNNAHVNKLIDIIVLHIAIS